MKPIDVTVTIERIGPREAEQMLAAKLACQRKLRPTHISRLSHDMKQGQFLLGPDAILLVKGMLANGQHRLHAVLESGNPQPFLVMRTDDETLYRVIDDGIRRTAGDSVGSLKYNTTLPPMARYIYIHDKRIRNVSDTYRVFTKYEVVEFVEDHANEMLEAIQFVFPLYSECPLLPKAMGAALYYIAQGLGILHPCKTFLQAVYGTSPDQNLTATSAAGDMHKLLTRLRGHKHRVRALELFAMTVKSFRSFLNGTRPASSRLQWRDGEEFPTLKDCV